LFSLSSYNQFPDFEGAKWKERKMNNHLHMSSSALNLLTISKTAFMQRTLFLLALFVSQSLFAQFHFGAFLGGSSYIGDLNDKPFKRTKPSLGISLNYELSDRVMLRSGFTVGTLEGGDQYSGTEFLKQNRNLSFQSRLADFSLLGEVTIFNLYDINWSPYVFAGISTFHFSPYAFDSGQRIYLQPLTTEGQGLPSSQQDKYNLTQFAIPFGGGVKFNLNENIRLGVELGLRRTFTDYLDDVSGFYPDEAELLAGRGPNAVRFSYRGDEVPGETAAYPDFGFANKGAERANPKTKDWYYFTGIHLTFRLGGGDGRSSSKKYGCPTVPM
jgi:opacity protein-like surface antigen